MSRKNDIRKLLIIAAAVCFAIATVIALGDVSGDDAAWGYGGLLALALSFLLV